MLIEFIKNKESEFNLCMCTGHNYDKYLRATVGLWITRDYKSAAGKLITATSGPPVQFPFTWQEYNTSGGIEKYRCSKCQSFPYRIANMVTNHSIW